LATRFEYYFRILSGKLAADGTWLNRAVDQPIAIAKLGKEGLEGPRVKNVAAAYRLMKLDQTRSAARVFDSLDKALFAVPMTAVGNFPLTNVGDRIAFGRHSVGHGQWGDISSDGVFYGLATAIVFYNQT
jgi:hypothetical protein